MHTFASRKEIDMEYDYKGQLIIICSHKNVSYFLYGENGDIAEYNVNSLKEAKRKIDEFYERNEGFYDCEGNLYQY